MAAGGRNLTKEGGATEAQVNALEKGTLRCFALSGKKASGWLHIAAIVAATTADGFCDCCLFHSDPKVEERLCMCHDVS